MRIADDVRLDPFDDRRWVVSTGAGRHVLVNAATAELVRELRAAVSPEDARHACARRFGTSTDPDAFRRTLDARLGGYGILDPDTAPRARQPAYIRPRVQLLSARAAGRLAAPLAPLFEPAVFWVLLPALAVALLAVCLAAPTRGPLGGAVPRSALALVAATGLWHELGHVAACARARVRHGGVGAGLYLFVFPVLYADISGVWQAGRERRVIANLGGVFAELLYATILVALYALVGWRACLVAAVAVAAVAGWQLNPFVRSDGYWLLCDLAGVPNLAAKSGRALRRSLRPAALARLLRAPGAVLARVTRGEAGVWLYGVLNAAVLAAVAGYSLPALGGAALDAPAAAARLAGGLLAGTLRPADFDARPLVALVLYVTLGRWVVRAARNWWASRGTRVRGARPRSSPVTLPTEQRHA